MKKIIIISAIVVLATCVWAQTEIKENTIQDTLNIETVVIDTLEEKVDPKMLLVEMNNFLDEKKKIDDNIFIPHLIYKENFHLSSLLNLNMRINKNGFSEIPFATGNLQIVQNNQNIYSTHYKRGNLFYNSWRYSLPIALTETYMGLGDYDMNNIAVSLMKGSIFGIPEFDMQLDFLGEKGIWQGYENEVIQNFHLHLSYDLDFAKIYFDNSFIDQKLPGEKDIHNYLFPFDSASNKENEYSVKIENKIIDIGLKYKYDDYIMKDIFSKERNFIQFLVQKKIHSQNHKLDFSIELVSEDIAINNYLISEIINKDNSYNILSANQDSNILGFNIGNTGYYKDKNNYQLDSEIIRKIFCGIGLYSEFNSSSTEFYQSIFSTDLCHQISSSIGSGFLFDFPFMKMKAIFGQHKIENYDGNYYYIQNSANWKVTDNIGFKYDLILKNEQNNHIVGNNTGIMRYPEWQISELLEFTYFLKYNNAIKLGLKHIYHSSYSYTLDDLDMIFENDTQNFDAYLRIQLTNKFEISVDAINLTNNKIMFTNYDHPGTHFNFNVHWIFIN